MIDWLRHGDGDQEPGGRIRFAMSAGMSQGAKQALAGVQDPWWKTFGTEADGTGRQWTDVDYVPDDPTEKKDRQPLRYAGLRLLKPRGKFLPTAATGTTIR